MCQTALYAKDLHCSADDDVPNARGIPLSRERVVRVPDRSQSRALHSLGLKTYAPLSQAEAEELLLPDTLPSAEQLLSHQAEDADDKAAQCRELARRPFFASQRDRLLKGAVAYEKYAAYTRSLPGELRPYLIRTKVLFEGTGAYSAFLKGDRLRVEHGSLGRGPAEPREVAVVVFVEGVVHDVEVSCSAAE